tara:strand:- start:7174 stop:8106 length:933 start_codon:yes stop_codon:yes gene_type:complete
MTAIIPQKMVRYISPDGTLTQEGILLLLSFQEQIEANMAGSEILQAQNVVLSTYGDKASVERKKKNLNKFGTNITIGTTYGTVAQFQGTTANETFVTTNIIDSVVSSSASDTTQTVTIEGHTIDVSGNLTFVVQDAVLNGQTEVTLTTPLARATRMVVKATGTFGTSPAALVGTVYVYDNTDGITAGVPNTAAATKILLQPDTTQTNKCATAISGTDYWFLTEVEAGIGNAAGPADRVTFKLERRDIKNGGPWVPVGREITVAVGNPSGQFYFQPLAIIPPNNDVRVVAKTNASTCEVFAEVQGYLALIV